MKQSQHLYNTTDKAKVRAALYEDQNAVDILTNKPLDYKDSVLDHNHKTHYVRGVIHRQVNAFLGKLENNYIRYLSWWYDGTLSDFLRQCADYIERPDNDSFIHDSWIKGLCIKFNKLNEADKSKVLKEMSVQDGKNSADRKILFKKALLSRRYTMTQVEYIISNRKGN